MAKTNPELLSEERRTAFTIPTQLYPNGLYLIELHFDMARNRVIR